MQGGSGREWEARAGGSPHTGWDCQADVTSPSGEEILGPASEDLIRLPQQPSVCKQTSQGAGVDILLFFSFS